jgi:uncharacterized membrane protein
VAGAAQVTIGERERIALRVAQAAWLGLIVWCVVWEAWLAPLRPGGSWLVLKILPLLFTLRGVLRGEPDALQWSLLIVLLYLAEATVRLFEPAPVRWMAGVELALVLGFFVAASVFLRPYKRAAKARRASEAGP